MLHACMCIALLQPADVLHISTNSTPPNEVWNGYKLCGDNLDMNIKRRHVRIDRQTESLHFFHYYGIKDRIFLSNASDAVPALAHEDVSNLHVELLLPSVSDYQSLYHHFSVLITRILVDELTYFKDTFGSEETVIKHIKHKFAKEMSTKSEVVI